MIEFVNNIYVFVLYTKVVFQVRTFRVIIPILSLISKIQNVVI